MRLVEGKLMVRSKPGAGTELTAEARLVTSAREVRPVNIAAWLLFRRERTRPNATRTARSK
jgi:hypothetical protein